MIPFFFAGGGGFVFCSCSCCCSANAFCSSNLICSMAPSGLPGAAEFDATNTPLPRPADFANPFSLGKVGCRLVTAAARTGFGLSACFLTLSDPPFQFKFITSSKHMFSTFLTTSGAALPKLGIAGGCDKFTTEDTAIIAPLQSGKAPLKSLPPTKVPSNIISTCSATMCVVCASVYPWIAITVPREQNGGVPDSPTYATRSPNSKSPPAYKSITSPGMTGFMSNKGLTPSKATGIGCL
mmetsp:Transcript_1805/g.5475  ORF Transcript_1805/g.5475 Transcript_1805/m.5475 type:complete len:239 (+) Transcript_1805:985-1701(+)